MGKVSNRFFVQAIQDGQVANGYLRSSKPLQQMWDPESKTCAPDWSVGTGGAANANQPVIEVVSRLSGTMKPPTVNTWYWNGQEITFTGNNSNESFVYVKDGKEYPLFVKGTTSIGGIDGFPTLRINGNLASAGNDDQDIISASGSVDAAGTALEYTMDIPFRISHLSGTGYWGLLDFVDVNDITKSGNSVITSPDVTSVDGKVKIVPRLYIGTQAQKAVDFSVKYYLEGYDTQPDSRFDSMLSGTDEQKSLTLTADDVTDNVTVRCDYYVDGGLKCSAFTEVDDAQDDDEMQITHPGGTNNASLRSGQSVKFTIWMCSKTDQTKVKTAYTTFKVKLLNSAGVTSTASLGGTVDANGYKDITQNNVTVVGSTVAAKAGQVEIDYDTAHSLGDSISGVVVAQ